MDSVVSEVTLGAKQKNKPQQPSTDSETHSHSDDGDSLRSLPHPSTSPRRAPPMEPSQNHLPEIYAFLERHRRIADKKKVMREISLKSHVERSPTPPRNQSPTRSPRPSPRGSPIKNYHAPRIDMLFDDSTRAIVFDSSMLVDMESTATQEPREIYVSPDSLLLDESYNNSFRSLPSFKVFQEHDLAPPLEMSESSLDPLAL